MRRAVGAVLVTTLATAMLVSSSPAQGSPGEDKRRVDRQLRQSATALSAANASAAMAQKLLADVAAKLPAAELAAAKAKGAAAAARVRRDIARQQVGVLRAQAAAAELQYDQAQADVEEARQQLDGYVSDAYKGGGANALTAMLDAKSPSELAIQMATLQYVARGKDEAVHTIELARLRSAQRRADVQFKKRLADKAAAAADKAFLASQAAEAASVAAEQKIENLIALRKGALAVAERERAAERARYAALQRQSRAIAALLRAAAAAQLRAAAAAQRRSRQVAPPIASTRSGSGRLLTPVQGRISSSFGNRFDPVYHVWRLHAGIDFAAPGGTPIYAAAAGVVVSAGWAGGYGNYTCISHGQYGGQGLATCYAHQSSIAVSSGQSVGRGQLIGRVGTTGDSTGNHLHFEVRLDGGPVDPMGWL